MAPQTRTISDSNPYVIVRWKPEDARLPVAIRGHQHLFIPRLFEAAFVRGDLHVHLELEATAALAEIYEGAGQDLPETLTNDDAIVKKVTATGDRFRSVTPSEFSRIPLRTWTRLAVAAAAGSAEEIRQPGWTDGATVRDWLEKKVSFSDLAPRRAGRPSLEAGFKWRGKIIDLDEVLQVGTGGRPNHTRAIQHHFADARGEPVPRRTAQRWWKRARDMSVQP
jgi:hypothetical protein